MAKLINTFAIQLAAYAIWTARIWNAHNH